MIGLVDGSVDVLDINPLTLQQVAEAGDSQFAVALRRAQAEPSSIDPQAAVARFDSAW